jgi:hypothetical protein
MRFQSNLDGEAFMNYKFRLLYFQTHLEKSPSNHSEPGPYAFIDIWLMIR